VLDCQWLQQLRGDGLLRGALRPGDGAVALRAFARQRHALLRSQAHAVQQRQEAWVQMNLQLTSVIADVVGVTGQAIVRAIAAGERDPCKLAALRNCRIKASETDIALALQGNWRHEHLFALRQALAAFDFCGQQLTELDAQIEAQLARLHVSDALPAKGRRRSVARNASDLQISPRPADHTMTARLTAREGRDSGAPRAL
jgi:transposase